MKNITATILTAVFILSGLLSAAFAHESPNKKDIITMIKESDLIFFGTVASVDYKTSFSEGDGFDELPHTFVTYKIEKILKGNFKGKSFTLRILGGRGKEAQFLMVANYPLFDQNNRDILFVKNNTAYACPLVDCAKGRFRVIKEMVYDDNGKEILLTKERTLKSGKYQKLDEVLTHHVSKTVLKRVVIDEPGEARQDVGVIEGKHLDVSQFIGFLNDTINKTYTAEDLKRMPEVVSANIAEKFFVKSPKPVMTPVTARTMPTQAPSTDSEKLELELFEKSGNNPVISKDLLPKPKVTTNVPVKPKTGGVR